MLPAIARLERVLASNSPALMTAVGVTGVVTTAVLSAKSGAKANDILTLEMHLRDQVAASEETYGVEPTIQEKVNLTWKVYVPPVVSGVVTVAAIVAANRIGARRAAGLAAALTLGEKAYSEYQEKVVETLGVQKEEKLRTELVQKKMNRIPDSTEVLVVGTDVRCYDAYTDRYFTSDHEKLRKVQNDFNQQVINDSYSSLTELYTLLGLPRTSQSDDVGFTTDKLLDFNITAHLSPDGKPCIGIDYSPTAIRGCWG